MLKKRRTVEKKYIGDDKFRGAKENIIKETSLELGWSNLMVDPSIRRRKVLKSLR
jgi:hypothetical protein